MRPRLDNKRGKAIGLGIDYPAKPHPFILLEVHVPQPVKNKYGKQQNIYRNNELFHCPKSIAWDYALVYSRGIWEK